MPMAHGVSPRRVLPSSVPPFRSIRHSYSSTAQ
jgi:hypothetical protein